MSTHRATVYIHRFYNDSADQGALVAVVEVDDYKFAASNARELFVRDHKPPSGKYLAFTTEQNGHRHASLLFEVKRAEAVIISHGNKNIVGGDFGWSPYALNARPKWGFVDDEYLSRERART